MHKRARTAFLCDCAGLAQLVEQLICNHQVASSNPAAGTTFQKNSPHITVMRYLFSALDNTQL